MEVAGWAGVTARYADCSGWSGAETLLYRGGLRLRCRPVSEGSTHCPGGRNMPDGNTQMDGQNRTEIDRVKAIIRQKLESAEPGRNGGLLNADGKTLATTAARALDDVIDELKTELNQVTGEETNV